MIDNEKIGNYIKELRKKHKLTQEELADIIHVSRQAISNWETGKDAPNIDNVKSACMLFDVSMADIYAGEEIKDIKSLNDVIHGLLTMEMKRSKKIMLFASIIIFFLIILFLVYYFITYYNNITAYIIKGNSSDYDINGIVNKSVDNMYFSLEMDTTVDRICLVYNETDLYCVNDSNYIIFKESNGYNEIIPLDKKSFNDYISNLYINIEDNKTIKKIKLDLNEEYRNSNFIKENNPEINKNDNEYTLEYASVPNKIKETFKYNKDDNSYYLKKKINKKQIEISYMIDNKLFIVKENNDGVLKDWEYYFETKELKKYEEINLKDGSIINSINDINEKKYSNIYDYFKINYIDKYLK